MKKAKDYLKLLERRPSISRAQADALRKEQKELRGNSHYYLIHGEKSGSEPYSVAGAIALKDDKAAVRWGEIQKELVDTGVLTPRNFSYDAIYKYTGKGEMDWWKAKDDGHFNLKTGKPTSKDWKEIFRF